MTMQTMLIGLCTFRRPQVLDTLASLDAQRLPEGVTCRIVVVDNDDGPTAKTAVETFGETSALKVDYLHRPARNISLARNAVLDQANLLEADVIAFIDDDEIASTDWLAQLLACQHATGAEVVLGPVQATYADDAPEWMVQGQVHDTLPTIHADGGITSGYTCNLLLMRRSFAVAPQRFDLARGTSGGEDTAFVTAIHQAGGRIAFAPDAWLTEEVPPHRATRQWLLTRRFRMGQTHGSLIGARAGALRRTQQAGIALAKLVACGAMALISLPRPLARNRALMRGALHLGNLSALTGFRTIAIYGAATPHATTAHRRST